MKSHIIPIDHLISHSCNRIAYIVTLLMCLCCVLVKNCVLPLVFNEKLSFTSARISDYEVCSMQHAACLWRGKLSSIHACSFHSVLSKSSLNHYLISYTLGKMSIIILLPVAILILLSPAIVFP